MATLKAGTYYIGDPGYLFDDSWKKILEETDYFEGVGKTGEKGYYIIEGYPCVVGGTVYGDGTYGDNEGFKYSVDAGLIGCLPVELIELDKKATLEEAKRLGRIVTFSKDFHAECDNGYYNFGDIEINTGNDNYGEIVECADCGNEFNNENEGEEIYDEWYCDDCKDYGRCKECDEDVDREEWLDNEGYCENCAPRRCTNCSSKYSLNEHDEDSRYDEDDMKEYCPECIEGLYKECAECGESYKEDEGYEDICKDCYNNPKCKTCMKRSPRNRMKDGMCKACWDYANRKPYVKPAVVKKGKLMAVESVRRQKIDMEKKKMLIEARKRQRLGK